MKKLFIIIIIFISFQSLSKADDISDFQIEGISIGDSALDHFSKKEIDDQASNGNYKSKKFKYVTLESDKFKIYDDIQIHYLGYYKKWIPQEAYYYSVENSNFSARPYRTQGTYSKYSSIDDKIDDLHYYTTFIKFGLGRATYDAAQEIRNKHLNLEEGKLLVKKFDGEFPDRYFSQVMEYIDMNEEKFHELCDAFRSPHLWIKTNKGWKLRHNVYKEGYDD